MFLTQVKDKNICFDFSKNLALKRCKFFCSGSYQYIVILLTKTFKVLILLGKLIKQIQGAENENVISLSIYHPENVENKDFCP